MSSIGTNPTKPITDSIQNASSVSSPNSQTSSDYINSIYNNTLAAKKSALEVARQNSLSGLDAEQAAIQPKYYDARNQQSALNQQQARNFAEYMANRGNTSSGVADQGTMVRNAAYQGQIGALNREEAAAYADIERRRQLANSAYDNGVVGATNETAAARDTNLMNQYNTDRTRADSLLNALGLGYDQNGNIVQTVQGKLTDAQIKSYQDAQNNWNKTYDYNAAQDAIKNNQWNKTYDYNSTQDAIKNNQWNKTYDYNAAQDAIKNNQWNKIYDYNAAQDVTKNNQWNKTFDYNAAQDVTKNNQWNKIFDYNSTQDAIKNNQWEISHQDDVKYKQDVLSLSRDQFSEEKAQNLFDREYKNKSFDYQKMRDSIVDGQFSDQFKLQLDKFAWEKSDNNPAVKSQILQNELNDYKLKQAKDPNSIENRSANAELNKIQASINNLNTNSYNSTRSTDAEIKSQTLQNEIFDYQLKQAKDPRSTEAYKAGSDSFAKYFDKYNPKTDKIEVASKDTNPQMIPYLITMYQNGTPWNVISAIAADRGINEWEVKQLANKIGIGG